MTTTANPPPGAVPTGDLFTTNPSQTHPAPLRYAAFDNTNFSMYSTSSPSAARRTLEAHLKDTDRRIQDASRLGTTLVQQRKDLAARLKEVEQMQQESEVPDDLRKKLAELEREYNEIGRESARAFLPRSRMVSENGQEPNASSAVISGSGRESPTKLSAPSRRQRNQPTNRVHDIEFATEISTSLLAQVRQLQAALAEKDDELKDITQAKAVLEAEATALVQKIRHMDANEQKYKDENWNLETRLQELEASFKQSTDKETKLAQALKSTQSEMSSKERELEDLKATHDRLTEDHAMAKKVQEADLHGLRRDAATYHSEQGRLQKKIEELTSQNTELAKAVAYRFSQQGQPSDTDFVSAEEGMHSDDQSPRQSDPGSPIKGTPARHGMLESETLKSSLNHAHRMIQNLKNTIHREKTEKIELKRMLQDARDEIENRENAGVSANIAKKRRTEPEGIKFKRPSNLGKLGAARSSRTEILEDEPDWEDHEIEQTPSKPRHVSSTVAGAVVGAAAGVAFDNAHNRSEDDTTDDFETADERRSTTESEAFATGNEDFDEDSEGDLTETEGHASRVLGSVGSLSSKPRERQSFMSTASTSGDEVADIIRTPVQNVQPKYRLRVGRGVKRSSHVSSIVDSPGQVSTYSPASSNGTPQPAQMQSLGDELDAIDDDSVEGTPVASRFLDDEIGEGTPETQRFASTEPETPSKTKARLASASQDQGTMLEPSVSLKVARDWDQREFDHDSPRARSTNSVLRVREPSMPRPEMVDSGVMTEPWEPERIVEERIVERIVEVPVRHVEEEPAEKQTLRGRAGELVGSALAGFGLSKVTGGSADDSQSNDEVANNRQGSSTTPRDVTSTEMVDSGTQPTSEQITPSADKNKSPTQSQQSHLVISAPPSGTFASAPVQLTFSDMLMQDFEPVPLPESDRPEVPRRSPRRSDQLYGAVGTMHEDERPSGPHNAVANDREDAKSSAAAFAGTAAPIMMRERWNTEPKALATDWPNDVRSARIIESELPFNRGAPSGAIFTDSSPSALRKQPMSDEGSQTIVSGEDVDGMIRNKRATVIPAVKDAGSSPFRGAGVGTTASPSWKESRRSAESRPPIYEPPTLRAARRPGSAGSVNSVNSRQFRDAPPLPPDHTQKIAAAAQYAPDSTPTGKLTVGTMGPPTMPASAYKARPLSGERAISRDGTTPRAVRVRDSRTQLASDKMSNRASVSSFASEIDDRFNITRGHIMYPNDIEPATDPRMIQAITQTMIGEYLWKYTRKAGRSEVSSSRHRRFFWVHPYTRTLYWSEQDPSTAGKNMLKAKSVAIDAVRVTSDDNAYPPGLHRKSLVVVTPGREIVFTAPTSQRHETWFNALSYLLLRTEREKSEAEDTYDEDDIDEFNPGVGRTIRRSISRMAGTRRSRSRQSRASLSSYNSRTTTTSPARQDPDRTVNQRHGTGTITQKSLQPPGQNAGSSNTRASSGSMAGRISSITSRFARPSSSHRARSGPSLQRPEDPAQIYDASVVPADSAEDLRAVIERQERDADRLENVRACCDGKHDVGSLSRSGRHASVGHRFGSHGHHSHSHR